MLFAGKAGAQAIYLHNFDGPAPGGTSYTVAPTATSPAGTENANLTGSTWTSNGGGFTTFAGAGDGGTGSLALSTATPSTTILTLTFSVNPGYTMNVTGGSLWRQASGTGYTTFVVYVNGTPIGSGSIPASGSVAALNIGTVSNITGNVTVLVLLSGGSHGSGGTFRLDDFTLNGSVTALPTPPVITVNPSNASACTNANTSFGITATNAVSYQWQRSTTGIGGTFVDITSGLDGGIYGASYTTPTLTLTAPPAGVNGYAYQAVATNVNGSTTSNPATLTVKTAPTATIAETDVACHGSATGSATVTVTSGTPNYTYAWTPSGGSAATASNLAAGAYTCTVTDATTCTVAAVTTINQPAAIVASATQTNVLCNGGATGSATVTATGGTGLLSYAWTPSGGNAATASNLAAGTYTCTVTDANACTTTKVVNITEPAILAATATQTNVLCNGGATGSATVTATGGNGTYTYSWAPSGGTAAIATGLAAGSYTCTVTDANLCTTTATMNITEPSILSAAATQTNVLCNGSATGSATVTATGGNGTYTYSWAPSGGTAAIATGLAAGSYTCTVTDANLCTTTTIVNITQPSILSATATQTNVLCNGSATGSATVTATGGNGTYTYSWAPSGGTAAIASGLAAGVYTCTVTDANLCTTNAIVNITQPSVLSATATQTNVLCNGSATGSATVTATGGNGTYTYSWAPSGGTAAIASGLAAGIYTCTVTDANLCTTTAIVNITQPSVLSANATQTNVSCNGSATGSATVTATGGNGTYTYSWAPTGGTAAIASGLAAGSYTCTVTDANLCTTTAIVNITQPSVLSATTTQTNVLCNGSATGSATVTVTGGTTPYTYAWAPSGGTASIASGLAANTYTCTITDAHLCSTTKIVTITQPNALMATTTQINVLCNGSATGSATVTATGGNGTYTYSWAPTGGNASTASNLAAGTYTCTITDANLCSIAKTVSITQPAVLAATTTQTNVLCNGGATGSATVTATGGNGTYTYAWAPTGGVASIASNLAAGTYTCTITDANFCSITKVITITQPNALTATTTQTNVLCNGSATGSATVTATGGTGTLHYSWAPSGGNAAIASNLAAATYTCTITDANLCSTTNVVTITQPTAITATATQTNVLCNGSATGSATVTATGGTGTLHYSWAPSGGTAAIANNLTAGTYTCTITDANLCFITKVVTITQPLALAATTTQTNILCNGATTGSATIAVTGGNGAYTYAWTPSGGNAATAANLAAGTYTCTVTDANLCIITETVTLIQPTAITTTTSQTNVGCNGAITGAATVMATGGTGTYTYEWTPIGGNSETASNLPAGTYTCTVTDANLCTATPTVTITEPAPLNAVISGGTTICAGSSAVITFTGTPNTTVNYAANGTGESINIDGSGVATVTVTPANTTTYALINIIDNVNGCNLNLLGSVDVVVTPMVTPTIAISADPGNVICAGTSVTFTATITNGGTAQYQWQKNGTDITGANSDTYTDNSLADGDIITCVLTSDAMCAITNTATSAPITITVNPMVTPVVTIFAAPGNVVNFGTPVTFISNIFYGGLTPTYKWVKNGVVIPGATNSSYTENLPENNDTYACIVTSDAPCLVVDTAISSPITMSVLCVMPANITASNLTFNGATLSWDAITGADGFEYAVDQSANPPASGTPTVDNTVNVNSLIAGQTYYAHVRTVCTNNLSYSDWSTISFTLPSCTVPASLNATNITESSADLTWSANVGGSYEYALDQSLTPPASGTNIAATTYNASGLSANTNYFFHLRNACGGTDFSDWVTIEFVTNLGPTAVQHVNNNDFAISAYPNPTRDKITLSVQGMQGNVGNISIMDLTGKTISTFTFSGNKTNIDMGNLAPGTYMIKYNDALNVKEIKLVKE